jgi:hypothetical protein
MAQVNSTPGKNEVNANVVVVPGPAQPGAQSSRTFATNTTVSYMQSEPGKHDGQRS